MTFVLLQADSLHYHGFVHFRQVKNPSIPRGYFQKVIESRKRRAKEFFSVGNHRLTTALCSSLYACRTDDCTGVLRSRRGCFRNWQESMHHFIKWFPLVSACHDIDQWPAPEAGKTYSLPLMGNVIQCALPSRSEPTSRAHTGIGSPARMASYVSNACDLRFICIFMQ